MQKVQVVQGGVKHAAQMVDGCSTAPGHGGGDANGSEEGGVLRRLRWGVLLEGGRNSPGTKRQEADTQRGQKEGRCHRGENRALQDGSEGRVGVLEDSKDRARPIRPRGDTALDVSTKSLVISGEGGILLVERGMQKA